MSPSRPSTFSNSIELLFVCFRPCHFWRFRSPGTSIAVRPTLSIDDLHEIRHHDHTNIMTTYCQSNRHTSTGSVPVGCIEYVLFSLSVRTGFHFFMDLLPRPRRRNLPSLPLPPSFEIYDLRRSRSICHHVLKSSHLDTNQFDIMMTAFGGDVVVVVYYIYIVVSSSNHTPQLTRRTTIWRVSLWRYPPFSTFLSIAVSMPRLIRGSPKLLWPADASDFSDCCCKDDQPRS